MNELKERIVDPMRGSMEELCIGFHSVVSASWLSVVGMSSADLKSLICGNLAKDEDFQIRELFHIRTDNDVKECPELFDALFSVVDTLDSKDKRAFLKFVTGIDKLPLPMSETIKIDSPFMCFSDEEHRINLQRLPTAHTCFNTLEVPNYLVSMLELQQSGAMLEDLEDSAGFIKRFRSHLKDKLMLAIANVDGCGYGLDEGVRNREINTTGNTTATTTTTKGTAATAATSDSDTGANSAAMEVRPSVTIVREEPIPSRAQTTSREKAPREETPREENYGDSDDSYDIPGLGSDDDGSDLDDLFDGFD